MAAQKGRDLLLKLEDGGTYLTVAGLRSRRLAFNAEPVDVSDAESAERWRGWSWRSAGISDRRRHIQGPGQ